MIVSASPSTNSHTTSDPYLGSYGDLAVARSINATVPAGNGSHRELNPDFEIAVELPAAADGVVSVAALGQSPDGLQIAPFSNTFTQISGPGVKILSAKRGGGLISMSRTSMAGPPVAGVTALWWQAVTASPLPATPATVTAKLLANAATSGFASGVEVADRGVGLVRAPQAAT